ncbi:MAG: helix-turn-helix domain-containing protein [Acidobacteria bacterium]|nr:helix-turn-helix domain-containing protein [Acidobacteriota bacterium]
MEKLLTVREVAEAWFEGKGSRVYEAVRYGHIPYIRIGRNIRFLQSSLERFAQEQTARNIKAQTQDQSLTAAV